MLALTLVALSLGQIGSPRGVHLLDDTPLLAQAAPPLVPTADLQPQSDAQVSAQQLQVDLAALKQQRPSIGGGIALVSAGGTVALLSVSYLGLSGVAFFAGINPFIMIGAVGLGVGLPLVVIGIWLLYNRLEERKHIDEQTARLKKELQLRQPQRTPSVPANTPPGLDLPPPQVRGPAPTMLIASFG